VGRTDLICPRGARERESYRVSALDLFSPDFDLGVKSRGRDYFRRRRV